MSSMDAIDLVRQAMMTTAVLVAPAMIVALVAGTVVSLLQAVTQVQDQTISFVPKLLAVGVALMVCLPWMTEYFLQYAQDVIMNLPASFSGG